ncbi:MAG: class I SAM-dependent methyltransferase [Acidobacteria bacterium]|nr:class I SAM-dependent methyltransferase [Acidobacteriota bacterium]
MSQNDLSGAVLDLLAPQPGERILDVGCGHGALTEKIAAAGTLVTGIDTSPELIAAACARGLDARPMDGQALPFDQEFDAVFSNAALHWMPRSDDVLRGVYRALKPGGRFVGEFGGKGNVASMIVAMMAVLEPEAGEDKEHAHWYFPTAQEYREKLEQHGFQVRYIASIPPPALGGDPGKGAADSARLRFQAFRR